MLDEDDFARRAFRLLLERAGLRVTTTAAPTQALDRAELDGADVLASAERVSGASEHGVLTVAREASSRCVRVLLHEARDGDAAPPSSRGVAPDLTSNGRAALTRRRSAALALMRQRLDALDEAEAAAAPARALRVGRAIDPDSDERSARDEKLAAEAIPYAAHVFRVLEAHDALVSGAGAGRTTLSHGEAIREREVSGATVLDPHIVAPFGDWVSASSGITREAA